MEISNLNFIVYNPTINYFKSEQNWTKVDTHKVGFDHRGRWWDFTVTVVAVVGSRGDGDGGEINFHHRGGPRGDGYWAKISLKKLYKSKK